MKFDLLLTVSCLFKHYFFIVELYIYRRVKSLTDWTALSHDETFLSWWEWCLPGWLHPYTKGPDRTLKWFDEYENDVNPNPISHRREILDWHVRQRRPPPSSKHQLSELFRGWIMSIPLNTVQETCRIYAKAHQSYSSGSRRPDTLSPYWHTLFRIFIDLFHLSVC